MLTHPSVVRGTVSHAGLVRGRDNSEHGLDFTGSLSQKLPSGEPPYGVAGSLEATLYGGFPVLTIIVELSSSVDHKQPQRD